jgi:hypothetical protein
MPFCGSKHKRQPVQRGTSIKEKGCRRKLAMFTSERQ